MTTLGFEVSTVSCEENVVLWDGKEGPTGIGCQRDQVVLRSGSSELRRLGGHGEPQQGDSTRRPTTRTHTIITKTAIDRLFSG